tara:strand:+ start:236 stop:469 length:234 start_codon:yes stop_codon:yes gene_type:complete
MQSPYIKTSGLNPQDKVKFTGYIMAQVKWGGCDEPDMLEEGKVYTIEEVEVHSWHTKIKLEGIEGKFNSVCFEEYEN